MSVKEIAGTMRNEATVNETTVNETLQGISGSEGMKMIGLTGGVGCGKSTVAEILKESYGAFVIMADLLGHLAMEPDSPTYKRIVDLFGEEILDGEGRIDRKRLGDLAFPQPEKLAALNGIIHPFVRESIDNLVERAKQEGYSLVVLETAILLESGYQELCDEIWVVTAKKEVRFARLQASRGYTREKFEAILAQQLPEGELLAKADVIIENNGEEKELKETVQALFPLQNPR